VDTTPRTASSLDTLLPLYVSARSFRLRVRSPSHLFHRAISVDQHLCFDPAPSLQHHWPYHYWHSNLHVSLSTFEFSFRHRQGSLHTGTPAPPSLLPMMIFFTIALYHATTFFVQLSGSLWPPCTYITNSLI
jgi:hypothetical protein